MPRACPPLGRLVRPALAAGAVAGGFSAGVSGQSCPADLDGDERVESTDLTLVLAQWGLPGATDLDGDGDTGAADLALVLALWGPCPGPGGIVAEELAAVPRATFPFASRVETFLTGSTVHIALDLVRFPALAGRTVNAFLVDDRDRAGWTADPTLPGEAVPVAFGFDLAGGVRPLSTASLPGPTSLAFSRGYDLVLDADGSGTLSDGDLIDGLDGPGFFLVANASGAGPLAVTTVSSWDTNDPAISSTFQLQRVWYPSGIASMDPLPLVVISHGNGHSYTWYDYLGSHLASWGFVVMAHQNNTSPGIESASTTTLEHTDAILAAPATLAGGALAGRIDPTRIAWIGHSRGGEGVVRAYDRIFDGTYVPALYTLAAVRMVSSIAPTDFLGAASANPHAANYHLLYGAADGDVCGCPDSDVGDSFNLFERATGERASTYVHGADHNDFNCCGFEDFAGPAGTAIGRPAAQVLTRATYLALLRHFLDGDPAAREFLWRPYEDLRPPGVGANVQASLEWKPAEAAVVDDFQTQTAIGTSSSGGTVSIVAATSPLEGFMNDNNTSFSWLTSDPWNGMTRARAGESTRGLVFDWTGPSSVEFSVVPALRDFTARDVLSLRAAQGTRHPRTVALAGPVQFTVTLVDGAGRTSSLAMSAGGAVVRRPYQRTGFGTGAGWQNEFAAVRLRIADFAAGGRDLDLADIAAIRLEFGEGFGSGGGRLAIDDLRLEER
jgi:hypothetical protein